VSSPVDPVNLPLIAPTPPAQPVARRRIADDRERPPGGRRDEPQRDEAGEDDEGDGFPHVDVRV
jgi:hypothetical protein